MKHKQKPPAKVFSIQNEKGGTSKSTTATTLAYLLAKRGEKVALIDFDGQGHASMLCGAKNLNQLEVTISTLLNKHDLSIAGVLVTMDSERTKVSATVNAMLEKNLGEQLNIFKTRIPRSIKVAEASLYQKTICEYMPDNPAAVAYEKFVEELMKNEHS